MEHIAPATSVLIFYGFFSHPSSPTTVTEFKNSQRSNFTGFRTRNSINGEHFYDSDAFTSPRFRQLPRSPFLHCAYVKKGNIARYTLWWLKEVTSNKLLFDFNRLSFKFISIFQLKLIGTSHEKKGKKKNCNEIYVFVCLKGNKKRDGTRSGGDGNNT